MADPRATPVSLARAVRLCALLVLSPDRFAEVERQDIEQRNAEGNRPELPTAAQNVRNALVRSLVLVVAAAAFGALLAWVASGAGYCVTPRNVAWLQVVGASLLLWGTLFVRGFEIQTYAGVNLSERVNQWLYRFLYCGGTAVIVYSLAFDPCA